MRCQGYIFTSVCQRNPLIRGNGNRIPAPAPIITVVVAAAYGQKRNSCKQHDVNTKSLFHLMFLLHRVKLFFNSFNKSCTFTVQRVVLLQAVEKLFSAFPRHSRACGNPGGSRCYWIPVFTGMTNYKAKEAFSNNPSSNDNFRRREHEKLQQLDLFYPQHAPEVSPQPQDGGPPVTMLLMRAAAHPTPASTEIAPNSQFKAQAPHSMHRSLSVIAARLSRISKTLCGQTSVHLPQPVHLSREYCKVVTLARYFIGRPPVATE
jgi:hypothetical protein